MQEALAAMLWVALGSALGGPTRYFVSGLVSRHIGETFPWGTMIVNISGAFVIGVIAAGASVPGLLSTPPAWQFAVTGFLGSYTTVSSFSLQTLNLARDGQLLRAASNAALSLILCLSAVALGFSIGARAFGVAAV